MQNTKLIIGVRPRTREFSRRFAAENKRRIIAYLAMIVFGAVIGVVTYLCLSTEHKNQIFSYMQNYFGGSILLGTSTSALMSGSASSFALGGAIFILGGIIRYIFPFALLRLASHGSALGYTCAFFLCRYGIKGFVFDIAVLALRLPPIVISALLLALLRSSSAFRGARLRPCAFFVLSYTLLGILWLLFECTVGVGIMRTLYSMMS